MMAGPSAKFHTSSAGRESSANLKATQENVNKKYFPDILADLSDNDDTNNRIRNIPHNWIVKITFDTQILFLTLPPVINHPKMIN